MSEFFSLQDNVAVITGGTSGIGLKTAERFIAAGARVVIQGFQGAQSQVVEECPARLFPLDPLDRGAVGRPEVEEIGGSHLGLEPRPRSGLAGDGQIFRGGIAGEEVAEGQH